MREVRAGLILAVVLFVIRPALAAGDPEHGGSVFQACMACHSLAPDRNMTGPSLAGVWGRKAGDLKSFDRYSPALKSSAIAWDEKSLDEWLKAPQTVVPGNRMVFPGIPKARDRADLIAFIKMASAGGAVPVGKGFQDLKKLGADHQVQAIRYCRDTYHVTMADGQTTDFWEASLRFKTDSSQYGAARRQARDARCRDDGRPCVGVFRRAGRDQHLHQTRM